MLKELFNILMMNMMYTIKLGKKIDSSEEFDQYYKSFGKKKH